MSDLTKVKTQRYRPIGGQCVGAMYWGAGGFGSSINGFHLGYVERMKTDYQVSLCHDFLIAPIACATIALQEEPEALKAQLVIKADDPACGEFIKKILTRFWQFDLSHAMDDIASGYTGSEGIYKIEKGLLDWDYMKPLAAIDLEPHTADGKLVKVLLKPSGASGMTGDSVTLPTNKIDVPAEGLWFVNKPRMSLFYGRSDYYAAWHDWRVKSGMPDCVREIIFKATYKHAFSGMMIRYPSGNYVDENGQSVNNRDDAEQMVEIAKAGSNFAMSSEMDEHGNYLWAIESYGKNEVDISGLIPIIEMHDKGIRRGMNIPDEIIDHDGNTGGYARSRVAISAFFMGRQGVLNRKLEEWKRQVGDPLAKANFERSHYEIEVKSLLQDPEQAGQQPGQPGKGMSGMGGMGDGMGGAGMLGEWGQPEQYHGVGGVAGNGDARLSISAEELARADKANQALSRFGKMYRKALKAGYQKKTAFSLPAKKRDRTRLSADGLHHGPTAPGPDWKQVGVGERGGKVWKHVGGDQPGQDTPQDQSQRPKQQPKMQDVAKAGYAEVRSHVVDFVDDIRNVTAENLSDYYEGVRDSMVSMAKSYGVELNNAEAPPELEVGEEKTSREKFRALKAMVADVKKHMKEFAEDLVAAKQTGQSVDLPLYFDAIVQSMADAAGVSSGPIKLSTRLSHDTDKIPGGLAADRPDSDFPSKALAKGIMVELEHTSDFAIAKEIAKDHLAEDVEYYDKLETIEQK